MTFPRVLRFLSIASFALLIAAMFAHSQPLVLVAFALLLPVIVVNVGQRIALFFRRAVAARRAYRRSLGIDDEAS